ncbi:DALR domain-containing protein, partial [Staphylococcus pasteuri_A]|nr:cysteine--tRNA ligase [Staphylococcus pasteuri_A]
MNYSEDNLKQSRSALERLYTALRGVELQDIAGEKAEVYRAQFKAAMDDDFNTPEALPVLFE